MRSRLLFATSFVLLAACTASENDDSSSAAKATGEAPTPVAPVTAPPSSPVAPAPPAETPPKVTPDVGAIFVLSNAAAGNEVLAFERAPSGLLTAAGNVATGGTGSGNGLGSQGAVVLSADGHYLLAVDAGSSELTSFSVDGTKLKVLSHVASGGVGPVSVTVHGDLVYVLNAGDVSCISGFRLDAKGTLSPIPNSAHSLSAPAVGAAEVSFSPSGDALVVSEKATDVLDTFVVLGDGTVSNGQALPSVGKTPFGFAFTPKGHLIVSEAFGGADGAGALSSYSLAPLTSVERDLVSITSSSPDNQSAPCWVAITSDSRFAFTSNTASGSLSTYAIDGSGHLALQGTGISATTGAGSKPIDIALDRSTSHLYVLDAGTADLMTFAVGKDGSLKPLGSPLTVPATAVGLAAR